MSPSLESAEIQWLAQLRAMREAIADLKLINHQNGDVQPYGHDLMEDDDEATGGSGSDSIWDIIEEEGDVYSSDYIDSEEESLPRNGPDGASFGQEWLTEKCITFARGKNGMDPNEVQQQITSLLACDSSSMSRVILSSMQSDRTNDVL